MTAALLVVRNALGAAVVVAALYLALRELADVLQVVANCLFALRATQREVDGAIDHVQGGNHERGRHEVDGANALTVDWGAHD